MGQGVGVRWFRGLLLRPLKSRQNQLSLPIGFAKLAAYSGKTVKDNVIIIQCM